MSKHWRPDETVVRGRFRAGKRLKSLAEFTPPEWLGQFAPSNRTALSDGAKAGLVLMAAACLGIAVGLYQAFGPSDVFERDSGADWNAVEDAAEKQVGARLG